VRLDQCPLRVGEVAGVVVCSHTTTTSLDPLMFPLWDSHLEHWYGEPSFLIALVNSNEAHLFEVHASRPAPLRDLQREDVGQDIQRDKPQFTYKKRFAATGQSGCTTPRMRHSFARWPTP